MTSHSSFNVSSSSFHLKLIYSFSLSCRLDWNCFGFCTSAARSDFLLKLQKAHSTTQNTATYIWVPELEQQINRSMTQLFLSSTSSAITPNKFRTRDRTATAVEEEAGIHIRMIRIIWQCIFMRHSTHLSSVLPSKKVYEGMKLLFSLIAFGGNDSWMIYTIVATCEATVTWLNSGGSAVAGITTLI